MKLTLKTLLLPSCFRETSVPVADDNQIQKHLPASNHRSPLSQSSDSSLVSESTVMEELPLIASSNLHAFTLAEIRQMTKNISTKSFLGEGGFGPVHKGFIDENLRPGKLQPQTVAVKLLDLDGPQGHREWLVSTLCISPTA